MSGRIVGEVLDNAPDDLTTAQMLTFVALAEVAREKTRIAAHKDVSFDRLRQRTRLSERTLKTALKELVDRGLVRRLTTARTDRQQNYKIAELHPHHREVTR